MPRLKPHQPLYRPGSGPLRKSGQGFDDSESNKFDSGSNVSLNSLDSRSSVKTSISRRLDQYRSGSTNELHSLPDHINNVSLQQYRLELGSTNSLVDKRKNKKPEQAIYVPKPIAEREVKAKSPIEEQYTNSESASRMHMGGTRRTDPDWNQSDHRHRTGNNNSVRDSKNGGRGSESGSDNINSNNRSKRHGNRRYGHDHDRRNGDESWRAASPTQRHRMHDRRDTRQTSEPRTLVDVSRARATRSVEPSSASTVTRSWQLDTGHSKPPSGRRNSTISLGSDVGRPSKPLPNLPPRLQKNNLNNGFTGTNYIGTNSEDSWDGSSVTFQGTGNGNFQHGNQRTMAPHMQSLHYPTQLHQPILHNRVPQMWSQTLPNMRGRGRGRLRQDDMDMERLFVHGNINRQQPTNKSNAPNSTSRPNTPPTFSNAQRTVSSESLHRCQTPTRENHPQKVDRMYRGLHTPPPHITTPPGQFRRSSIPLEPQLSPGPNHQIAILPPQILDWSEEVELHAEIEEAVSDAMTRSSSMASLVDHPCNTHPPRDKRYRRKRNHRRKGDARNRSTSRGPAEKTVERNPGRNQRNTSADRNRHRGQNSRDNSVTHDHFRVPEYRDLQSRNPNRDRGQNHEGHRNNRRRRDSRDSSGDRSRKNSERDSDSLNWREEIRDRNNSEKEITRDVEHKNSGPAPGILVLPRGEPSGDLTRQNLSHRVLYMGYPHQNLPRNSTGHVPVHLVHSSPQQRTLFDPNNPHKPIVVTNASTRTSVSEPRVAAISEGIANIDVSNQVSSYSLDGSGNVRPQWYDPCSDSYRSSRNERLLSVVAKADAKLQWILNSGDILREWNKVVSVRVFLQESLCTLITTDLKFCQIENVEHHFWKILFYNTIEVLRKIMASEAEVKDKCKELLITIIDDGTKYLEGLLVKLEQTYSFKLDDFLGNSNFNRYTGLGLVGLSLVSAQKLYLFLGDLARYREQVNETTNYGKSRQCYIKAQQLNPKNGRPYNQLAILAMYARRKLDAVYYYMRSLMSSNPFHSARESLISLLDDNRKKYLQAERKRHEEKVERAKVHIRERERTVPGGNSLRREIWIHPEGGRRVHRTTSAQPDIPPDSEEEDFSKLPCSEINKRFVISYLHVHGKLITKIGMETFQEAGIQMLKEFRALLQHSPIPLNSTRFLQLLALNMFAIESTQLKEPQLEPGYRSEVQECALVVSLQMFSLILERCISLLDEQATTAAETTPMQIVGEDVQVILPAIKVWCDWMLCHSAIWNPPPSCADYRVGPQGDSWTRLAILTNLLEKLDHKQSMLVSGPAEGLELVRLPEDALLCGFTPLMYNCQDPMYVNKDEDMEEAQIAWRISRILFFGTAFLCGINPPVLKLQKFDNEFSGYISVVCTSLKEDTSIAQDLSSDSDLLVESFSEDEGESSDAAKFAEVPIDINDATTPEEIRDLLQRKEELEHRQKTQERHRERVQAILQQSVVSVVIEIKPRLLVPDTNCFIDYLSLLQVIAKAQINAQPIYTLSVPLIVLSELEGLARGGKTPAPMTRTSVDPAHIAKVAEAATGALAFLRSRSPAVRCVTMRGTVVPSSTFTLEENSDQDVGLRNDDRILATSVSLCRASNKDQHNEGEPRRLYRDVVLLTDDRNLRVKALARDVPVRELPDFLKWAGLG